MSKNIISEYSRTKPKQQLWFDPKNPPKTHIYVGQRIPIWIVPDDTEEDDRLVEPSWVKTDWVFKVVGIKQSMITDDDGNKVESKVVDVEWPNGHIDTDIPISNMYGHFARLPKSMVPRFTEEYFSEEEDDEFEIIDLGKDMTDQEKLEHLLKMLQFLSEQRERIKLENEKLQESPTIVVEETTDTPSVLGNTNEPVKCEIEETVHFDADRLQKLLPDLSPESIQALSVAAKKADSTKESESSAKLTKSMVAKWFRPPTKGGLRITALREKARLAGIKNPQKKKKNELHTEMMKIAV